MFVALLPLFASFAAALPSGAPGALLHNVRSENFTLSKRFSDARWTFYDPGLGACGKTNGASDFIVALNIEQWDGGSHCFNTVSMSYGGKSTTAQIVDECPGCPYGGLDLSPSLFSFFASQDLGVIQGTWSFGGSSGGGSSGGDSGDSTPTSSKKSSPSPSPSPSPTHTSHSSPQPTPTPTPTPSPSSSSSAHSVSSQAPSSSVSSSSAASTASSPAPSASNSLYTTTTVTSGGNGTISQLYLAVVQMGLLSENA